MKVTYKILAITDSYGNEWANVVNEMSDTVQVYGIHSADGSYFYFENEARFLPAVCEASGLACVVRDRTESLP